MSRLNEKVLRKIFLTPVYVYCFFLITTEVSAQYIDNEFETGAWSDRFTALVNNVNGSVIENTTNHSRTGAKSMRFFPASYSSANRCEVVSKDLLGIPGHIPFMDRDKEYWLGMSIYLTDWASNPPGECLLYQTHGIGAGYNWSGSTDPNGLSIYSLLGEFRIATNTVSNPLFYKGRVL